MFGEGFSPTLKAALVILTIAALGVFAFGLFGTWLQILDRGFRSMLSPASLMMLGGAATVFVLYVVAIMIDDSHKASRLPPPD